jgi:carbamoyl-phosphate synthase large subunit
MFWKNKKVFVSGGAGVIGKELVKKLHDKGAKLYVGDLKPKPDSFAGDIFYRQGDLNYITKNEIDWFEPEIFFHLAATFERTEETYEFWDENFHHNIKLSHHLASVFKEISSLKKVIFTSSYLLYEKSQYCFDTPQTKPVKLSEKSAIFPRNTIGAAKMLHEIELQFIDKFKDQQFKYIIARIFRGYGCGSKDVISRWVRDLIQNKEILLYAKEGIFDYIYAKDSAEGLIRLAECEKVEGIVNLGTGRSKRVADVVDVLRNYFPSIKAKEIKKNIEYEASEADIGLLKQLTNWKPAYDIGKAIPEIIEYEKGRKHLKKNSFNILITSISKKVPLLREIKKAAEKFSQDIQIFGMDIKNKDEVIGAYFVDKYWQSKSLNELEIKDIIDYCKNNNIKLIIPTRDGELEFWSKNKEILKENNIFVAVSELKSVLTNLDKLEFYKYCKANSIPAIPTFEHPNQNTADNWVVKERYGAGSRGIGINLGSKEAIEFSKKLKNPIFQPYINGDEVSIDSYTDKNGNVKGVVVRKRVLVVGGESQITEIVQDKELEVKFEQIIKKLNLQGHAVLQAIINSDGINIIECNPRFGGASTFSIAVGLDSFYWTILEANGVDVSSYPFIKNSTIKKQIRYPEDLIL